MMTEEKTSLEKAMEEHDMHYKYACLFAIGQVSRRGKYYRHEPWSVLMDMFGHGGTVSRAIWNKYKPKDYQK